MHPDALQAFVFALSFAILPFALATTFISFELLGLRNHRGAPRGAHRQPEESFCCSVVVLGFPEHGIQMKHHDHHETNPAMTEGRTTSNGIVLQAIGTIPKRQTRPNLSWSLEAHRYHHRRRPDHGSDISAGKDRPAKCENLIFHES